MKRPRQKMILNILSIDVQMNGNNNDNCSPKIRIYFDNFDLFMNPFRVSLFALELEWVWTDFFFGFLIHGTHQKVRKDICNYSSKLSE